MKTNQWIKSVFFLFSVAIVLFTASCSGDEGPAGPQGDDGEQGVQGIPGKDGAVIHNGTGAPAATLGNAGDMYLDKAASNLYGPKSNAGWGTPLNLKGATGAAGATGATGATGTAGTPGSKILSGGVNPAASTGAVGDYYLHRTTGDLFGPKKTSGWGTPINLKGTANVVASRWVDYNWNSVNTPIGKVMEYTIPSPILSAVGYTRLTELLNRGGVILVYGQNWGSSQVKLFDYEFRNGRYEASPNSYDGKIWFTLSSINSAQPLREIEYDPARGNHFRYVLIPAGVQLSGTAAATRSSASAIDWHKLSYEEVKELLDI